MPGQLFGDEARRAWLAAGAPDYNNPTKDAAGNVTGYQSVADQPMAQRSQENQNLAGIVRAPRAASAAAPDISPDWAKQGDWIQKMFTAAYGANAPTAWTKEHAAELARLPSQAALDAGNRSAPAAASEASWRQPAPANPATVGQRYPHEVASELAARHYAAQMGVPMDQARNFMFYAGQSSPDAPARQFWESALGMAQAGMLDQLLSPGQAPGVPGPVAASAPTVTTTAPRTAAPLQRAFVAAPVAGFQARTATAYLPDQMPATPTAYLPDQMPPSYPNQAERSARLTRAASAVAAKQGWSFDTAYAVLSRALAAPLGAGERTIGEDWMASVDPYAP